MVEKFTQFWTQLRNQSLSFYAGLTPGRKIALGAGLAVIFLLFVLLFTLRPTLKYEVAFTSLSAEDKTAILSHLKKMGVKEFKLEGDSLSVPEEKIPEVKMSLAEEGLPSTGVGVGWEKFDERQFGMSDFEQRINKVRALQGELARTIDRLEPVGTSRVHIVLPENTVFADDRKNPSASIYLKLKAGKTLSQRQVQGIIHLVAHAVEGLEPGSVSIIDQDGNMLTQPEDQDGGLDRVTAAQREYQRKVEKELEQKIRDILVRVVGEGKVVAKVQAAVDFKKVETTISDVDPERTAVIASQRNEQSMQGNGLNPTGVPGAKSNLPGEREDLTAAGGLSNSSKSNTENLNYEVKKTLSKIIEPVGMVIKLSASVLVDGKTATDGSYIARTPEEIEMMTKLVKNAIGFQESRDSLTVESTRFEMDGFALAARESASAKKISLLQTGIFAGISLLGMIFLYYAFLRPYFRWLTYDPEKRSREQFEVLDYELERTGSGARKVQLQEEVPFEKLSAREQIMYLAKHDPAKTTEAIRQLLNPNHS